MSKKPFSFFSGSGTQENYNILKPSEALQAAIEATATILDTREQGEAMQIIHPSMTDNEAISYMIAGLLASKDYEHKFSPQIMYSVLKNYCFNEITDNFLYYYPEIMKIKFNIAIDVETLINSQIDVLFDIKEVAIHGKNNLLYKKHWCPFKEPHKAYWLETFEYK